MPVPPADPIPPLRESRRVVPLEAQEASYFAASDRIASFRARSGVTEVPLMFPVSFRGTRPRYNRLRRPQMAVQFCSTTASIAT